MLAPDITAPTGLTAAISGDGAIVSGTGEAGASVTIRDPAGTVIGTATVAANGSYSATLTPHRPTDRRYKRHRPTRRAMFRPPPTSSHPISRRRSPRPDRSSTMARPWSVLARRARR
ncbi:Ig-like domain-containing protein [Sphingomonas sp. I4]